MEKLLFTLLVISCFSVKSQNTFPSAGNVGIGTTSPSEELEVEGTIQAENAAFTNAPTGVYNFNNNTDRVVTSSVLQAGYLINPTSRSRTLNLFDFPESNYDSAPTFWFSLTDRADARRFTMRAVEGSASEFLMHDKNQSNIFSVTENGNGRTRMILPKSNSHIMIGTTSYTDNGEYYQLNVNGKIRATEVKVYTGWADYVFEDNYNLSPLSEVEDFINKYGHLKNVPSAKEVEENGVKLGEINKILLEKIEELTLYLIEKDKQYQQLQKDIRVLKGKINSLKE